MSGRHLLCDFEPALVELVRQAGLIHRFKDARANFLVNPDGALNDLVREGSVNNRHAPVLEQVAGQEFTERIAP